MLLSEIVYNIKNLLEGGISTNDLDLSDRQIAFIVAYYRAKIIKQQTDQGQSISEQLWSDLGKVELLETDKYKGELHPIKTTKKSLPKIIQVANRDLIQYVGSLDGKTSYQRFTSSHNSFKRFRRYTNHLPSYSYIGNTFYFNNLNCNQKYVNIQAVVENPLDLQEYLEEEGECEIKGFDFEYPISATILDMIYKMMMDAELKLLLTVFKNTTNDSEDNPANRSN